jgi:hypothetical protein
MKVHQRFSISMDPPLAQVIRQRAEMNNRTFSAEAAYLMECALAEKSETTRDFSCGSSTGRRALRP